MVRADRAGLDIWPVVCDMVGTAFKPGRGDDTLESTRLDIERGFQELWVAHNGARIYAAATTRIVDMPNGTKICHITSCAGKNVWEWISALDDVERYARARGCRLIRLSGRKGWKKILQVRGYKEPWIFLEKEI